MIPRKSAQGIVALAVLTALSFWLGRGGEGRRPAPIAGLDTRLDYALREFEGRYFDESGKPAVHLRAPLLTNEARSGIGVIERPVFDVVEDGNLWNIVAESATVSADREHIVLSGEVNMRRREPLMGTRLEISTSEMTLEILPRTAHTTRRVHIQDGVNTLEGVGFSMDLTANRFRLEDQVKVRYAIN